MPGSFYAVFRAMPLERGRRSARRSGHGERRSCTAPSRHRARSRHSSSVARTLRRQFAGTCDVSCAAAARPSEMRRVAELSRNDGSVPRAMAARPCTQMMGGSVRPEGSEVLRRTSGRRRCGRSAPRSGVRHGEMLGAPSVRCPTIGPHGVRPARAGGPSRCAAATVAEGPRPDALGPGARRRSPLERPRPFEAIRLRARGRPAATGPSSERGRRRQPCHPSSI
jgi:hypothetical protein